MILFLLLLIGVGLAMLITKSASVQTWAAKQYIKSLAKDLETEITIGNVELNWPKQLILKQLLIEDQYGDTLAYFDELVLNDLKIDNAKKDYEIESVIFNDPTFHFQEDEAGNNLSFLLDYFNAGASSGDGIAQVKINSFFIKNGSLIYDNHKIAPIKKGLDNNHLRLTHLNSELKYITSVGDSIGLQVRSLKFKDKSGFEVIDLNADLLIDSENLEAHNFNILTPESQIILDYDLSWKNLEQTPFIDRSNHLLIVRDSKIALKDLVIIRPELEIVGRDVTLKGTLDGKLKDLKGYNIDMNIGNFGNFQGDFNIVGLPNLEETYFNFNAKNLRTSGNALKKFIESFMPKDKTINLPPAIDNLGKLSLNGKFTGFLHDFVANAALISDRGNITANLVFLKDTSSESYSYTGKMKTENFDLGNLLSNDKIGNITADLEVKASLFNLDKGSVYLKGKIDKLKYNNYEYSKLIVDGEISKQKFNGSLIGDEKNLSFDFEGLIDFSQQIPYFNFNAFLYHADLYELHFIDQPGFSSLTTSVELDMYGNELDNLIGEITTRDLSYCDDRGNFDFHDFHITIDQNDTLKTIEIFSDLLDGSLIGNYQFTELPLIAERIFLSNFSHLKSLVTLNSTEGYYLLDATIKNSEALVNMLDNRFRLTEGQQIFVKADERDSSLTATVLIPYLAFDNYILNNFSLVVDQKRENAYMEIKSDQFYINDSLDFSDVYMTANVYSDTVATDITWVNKNYNSAGSVAGFAEILGPRLGIFTLLPSQLILSDNYWLIENGSRILIDSSSVHVERFDIMSNNEKISAFGKISQNPEDQLTVQFQKIDLDHFNRFWPSKQMNVQGELNATISAQNLYNDYLLNSNCDLTNWELAGIRLGDFSLLSQWNRADNVLDIEGVLVNDQDKKLDIKGKFEPTELKDKLDIDIMMNQLDLEVLSAIPSKAVSDMGGKATGVIKLKGTPMNPEFSGELNLKDARVKVNYLNTTYSFNNFMRISPDWIGLDHVQITDREGNHAYLTGTVIHDNFKDWNFDIITDFDNFLLLETDETMNPLFHGRAFGSGSLSLSGFTNELEISVEAKTRPGTSISIPLDRGEEVVLESFVTFVSQDTSSLDESQPIDLSGISLNMDINVTPDAEVKLIFDETIGDVIKGNGNGLLSMKTNPTGEFEIRGAIEIEKGDYLFTLRNIINKRFTLSQGGTITWFGDPYQADLNLDATYTVRAPLHELMYENPEAYNKRIPVECKMHLSGPLTFPQIDFDILFPTLDPSTRSLVRNRINTEQELNRQIFALMVLNKFLPTQTGSGFSQSGAITEGAITTSSELLSSQVSNWLSQLSNEFDIGINYRPGDNISNEELAVALSTELFNDRLRLSGNFGVSNGNQSNNNASSLVGDFILEYIMTEDGRLRLKVFNESNDFDITNTDQAPNKQGVGLLYQVDFE